MVHKLTRANSYHRFSLDRFCVTPELLGARHTFVHSGRQVVIELPRADEDPNTPQEFWSVACYKWRSEGKVPLEYQVNTISLRIAIGDEIAVPEEALKIPPRRDELFSKAEREQLDQLIDQLSEVSADAFRYWLSVLRWKSNIGHIGEPRVKHPDHSSGGSALQESATGHRFWVQPQLIIVQGSKAVTISEWQAAQDALSDSIIPPIWFEFVFEGEQRINNNDLTGAVLCLAIALEAIIRTLATDHLSKQTVEPLILGIVDRANFRSILSRLSSISFWNSEWNRVVDFARFNALMDYRDRVMHSADTKDLKAQELRKLHAKVKSLGYFVSKFLGKE